MSGLPRSRHGLIVRPTAQTGACDYCQHTFRQDELAWVSENWVVPTTRRLGHVTATLCPECNTLAPAHCWSCGRLTGREDDQCEACIHDVDNPTEEK